MKKAIIKDTTGEYIAVYIINGAAYVMNITGTGANVNDVWDETGAGWAEITTAEAEAIINSGEIIADSEQEQQDTTAAKLDEVLTAKHEEAKHFNDAMSERFDPISEIIILHAIANAAEEVYDNHPEDEHAEQMFDEAYKDEWNAVESFVESLTAELKCSSNAARAAIWRYIDAHPVAFRDEHGTLEMELYSHAQEAANRIAQRYYTADTNAVYISQGTEYTLSADSFKNPLLVHFVGFGKNENLFVPACHLGSFLPGVASEGMQIVKGVIA